MMDLMGGGKDDGGGEAKALGTKSNIIGCRALFQKISTF